MTNDLRSKMERHLRGGKIVATVCLAIIYSAIFLDAFLSKELLIKDKLLKCVFTVVAFTLFYLLFIECPFRFLKKKIYIVKQKTHNKKNQWFWMDYDRLPYKKKFMRSLVITLIIGLIYTLFFSNLSTIMHIVFILGICGFLLQIVYTFLKWKSE